MNDAPNTYAHSGLSNSLELGDVSVSEWSAQYFDSGYLAHRFLNALSMSLARIFQPGLVWRHPDDIRRLANFHRRCGERYVLSHLTIYVENIDIWVMEPWGRVYVGLKLGRQKQDTRSLFVGAELESPCEQLA